MGMRAARAAVMTAWHSAGGAHVTAGTVCRRMLCQTAASPVWRSLVQRFSNQGFAAMRTRERVHAAGSPPRAGSSMWCRRPRAKRLAVSAADPRRIVPAHTNQTMGAAGSAFCPGTVAPTGEVHVAKNPSARAPLMALRQSSPCPLTRASDLSGSLVRQAQHSLLSWNHIRFSGRFALRCGETQRRAGALSRRCNGVGQGRCAVSGGLVRVEKAGNRICGCTHYRGLGRVGSSKCRQRCSTCIIGRQ